MRKMSWLGDKVSDGAGKVIGWAMLGVTVSVFSFLGYLGKTYIIPLGGVPAQISAMTTQLDAQSKSLRDLEQSVTFIEDNMTAPRVANFESNEIIGKCTRLSCVDRHIISRTRYGEECGKPFVSAEIEISGVGVPAPLSLGSDFHAVEATARGRAILLPLIIDASIPLGQHRYRLINVYPTCPWSREPIPRVSRWFDLLVEAS